jgi:hypothetical protein
MKLDDEILNNYNSSFFSFFFLLFFFEYLQEKSREEIPLGQ